METSEGGEDRKLSDTEPKTSPPPGMSPSDTLMAEGLEHHQAGRLNRAEDSYRDALQLDPNNPDAYHLLGLIAHKTGHHGDAVRLIERAISMNADNPVFYANLAIVFNTMAREEDAEVACRNGLALAPGNIDLLNSLAHALARQGNFAGAEQIYRQAVEAEPNNATVRSNLATLLMEGGRLPEAREHLERAISVEPKFTPAHANISIIYRTFGRLKEAEAACRRAIAIDPSYTLGHLNLGTILTERRDFVGAEKAYRDVLRLSPDHPEALANLAAVAGMRGETEEALKIYRRVLNVDPQSPELHNAIAVIQLNAGKIREAIAGFKRAIELAPHYFEAYFNLVYAPENGFDSDTVAYLEQFLDADTSSVDDKIRLNFTLGEIHRRNGMAEKAWRHFVRGNELRNDMMRARGSVFVREQHDLVTKNYLGTFDAEYFAQTSEPASQSELPVFVIGVPRSGTSLVEQILSAHPEVFGAGELSDLGAMVERLRALGPGRDYPAGVTMIDAVEMQRLGLNYISRLAEVGGSSTRVIDKSPFNYRHLGLIARLFPNARVVYCRRDRLDTGFSCYVHNFSDTLPWTTALDSIGYQIRNYETFMAHWKETLPISIFEVEYEKLVQSPEPVSRKMIEYLGLEWDDACLSPHKARRVVQSASNWQVRQPISGSAVGSWQNYERFISPLSDALEAFVPPAVGHD